MTSILTESAKIKIANLLKRQVPLSGAKREYTPFSINSINLFNKDNSYTQYVVPAVFILILQQTLLIGLGILGGGINERMKNGDYGIYLKAKSYQVILSRVIIFGTIFFIHMLFYFGFSYENFHITHLANIEELLVLGTLFLLATLMFGIFLGLLFSSREIATPTILFSSLPLVFSIGFIWPVETIPLFINKIILAVPVTPAIHGFLELNQMGANFTDIMGSIQILLFQIVIYGTLGYYLINKRRNEYEQV
jgi:ABC-2 type transport system permease protein